MIKRLIIVLIFLYFLVLFQNSFLINFKIFGISPNLVLLAVILINVFFEDSFLLLFTALMGGFCLDAFSIGSSRFFGYYIIIALVIYFIISYSTKYFTFPHIRTSSK